jgi:response regulator RpfG family c-di-GMP phosphodiesterase
MMNKDADELFFAEEEEEPSPSDTLPKQGWKVMIVDDEQSVHDVTTLAFKHFLFQDKGLEFLHAYSGAQAKALIREHPDTALILLDVVMEEDDAGLQVARYVREELDNRFVRLVLRTGQPGQAPEERVVEEYDINDYREKTELTKKKLYTTIYSALRSYRDIRVIERNRQGLQKVIESSSTIFKLRSLDTFVSGLMTQVLSILGLDDNSFFARASGLVASGDGDRRVSSGYTGELIMSGSGRYAGYEHQPLSAIDDPRAVERVRQALREKRTQYFDDACAMFFDNHLGNHGLVYIADCGALDDTQRRMLDVFCSNISIAYANVALNGEIEQTQKETVYILGTVAEFRSSETAQHVVRVAKYAALLARRLGLDRNETERIELAAPLHDIGKIGIPDSILMKRGPLTAEELGIMKTHARIGYEMLKTSRRPILQAAATMALEHQEKWDGSGYPRGLAGEGIHLYGRIIAVADVFDALGSKRCYKESWELDRIVDYFRQQRGRHFDPQLADLLLDYLDEVLAIGSLHRDPEGSTGEPHQLF